MGLGEDAGKNAVKDEKVWITPESLEILRANMQSWVFAVAMSNLPIPMALDRYSPYRRNKSKP